MNKSERLLAIIRELEQLQAEIIMERGDPDDYMSIQLALNELYWLYKEMAAYELD